MPGHNLWRAQVPFGAGYLSSKEVLSRDLPYLRGWLLSLLAALSAWGLLSVTSLLRNSRRQAEMEAPLPGPCWRALFRKWWGGYLACNYCAFGLAGLKV